MPRFKKESALSIIRDDGKIDRYKAVLCKCKCGNTIRCKKTLVLNGRKKSCGCLNSETEYVSKYIIRMYWTSLLANAKSRNIQVKILPKDLDTILENQDFKCSLSGLNLILPNTHKEFLCERKWTASVDRIQSNKDYSKNNIQFVHKDINRMKMNMPEELFIKYCKDIARNK
jgi:hypothetical protein